MRQHLNHNDEYPYAHWNYQLIWQVFIELLWRMLQANRKRFLSLSSTWSHFGIFVDSRVRNYFNGNYRDFTLYPFDQWTGTCSMFIFFSNHFFENCRIRENHNILFQWCPTHCCCIRTPENPTNRQQASMATVIKLIPLIYRFMFYGPPEKKNIYS